MKDNTAMVFIIGFVCFFLFALLKTKSIERIEVSKNNYDSLVIYRNAYLQCNGIIHRANGDSLMNTKFEMR